MVKQEAAPLEQDALGRKRREGDDSPARDFWVVVVLNYWTNAGAGHAYWLFSAHDPVWRTLRCKVSLTHTKRGYQVNLVRARLPEGMAGKSWRLLGQAIRDALREQQGIEVRQVPPDIFLDEGE